MTGMAPTSYQHDVFISYSRTGVIKRFVIQHFYPKVRDWLREELGREVDIFIDAENLSGNEHWPESTADSLLASKCLIPVLTGRYFYSEWCLSEWSNFVEREKVLGFHGTRKSLIVPAIYHDGERFLREADRYIPYDFRNCGSDSPKFEDHASYPLFEARVRELAKAAAQVVEQAPDFNPGWPKLTFEPDTPTVPLLKIA
jgi:hypothetical protein